MRPAPESADVLLDLGSVPSNSTKSTKSVSLFSRGCRAIRFRNLQTYYSVLRKVQLFVGNPSRSYGASPDIWDHMVLPATWHAWMCPALSPTNQTWFTYPGGMERWVDLGVSNTLRWFICLQTVTHPNINHLTVTWPQVEPTTLPCIVVSNILTVALTLAGKIKLGFNLIITLTCVPLYCCCLFGQSGCQQ